MILGLVLTLISSIALSWVGTHVAFATSLMPGAVPDPGAALQAGIAHLASSPAPVMSGAGPMGGLLGFAAPWVAYGLIVSRLSRNERPGEQSGSSRWAKRSDLVRFKTAKNPGMFDSIILTEHYGMAIKREGFDRAHDRNLNFLVIGGSGSGKTRYYVKPNVCQMNCDYVITDPKGTLLPDVGQMLVENGYDVFCFNTSLPDLSLHYNPFAYVKTDLDIVEFVDGYMALTSDQSKKGGDQFWDDSVKLLLSALIGFLRDWANPEEYNMGGLLSLLDRAEAKDDDESFKSELDRLFDQIETGTYKAPGKPRSMEVDGISFTQGGADQARTLWSPLYNRRTEKFAAGFYLDDDDKVVPCAYRYDKDGNGLPGVPVEDDFALTNYKAFRQAAGKTMKSVLISAQVRFRAVKTDEVRKIMSGEDDLHLERLGKDNDHPVAIFDTFKDTNQSTLGFLHGMLIWQVVQVCCKQADRDYGGKLPRYTHLILDEFKSLNLPKSVADMISVIRSRNLGMSVILQSAEQLYQMYDEHCANGIIGCCDTMLMLGGGDHATNKLVSESIGQETVDQTTYTSSHGGSGGYSKQSSTLGRALIDPAEVGRLPLDQALVLIKGSDPGRDRKYPLERHPRYPLIDPGHKGACFKQKFDLALYLEKKAERKGLPAASAKELPAASVRELPAPGDSPETGATDA